MTKIELIGGIMLLVSCLLMVVLCLMQDKNVDQNMTSAITGASGDSFYGKNTGRTKEAMLCKFTRVLAGLFFIVTLLVNILPVYIDF